MAEEEDVDIAAAMGFGSFGGTKKRKFDHAKSPKATADTSGANSTKLGVRTKKKADLDEDISEGTAAHHGLGANNLQEPSAGALSHAQTAPNGPPRIQQGYQETSQSATETVSFGGPPITKMELNALRFGVKNENGDTAYFLPNFVEDPWEVLAKGRK